MSAKTILFDPRFKTSPGGVASRSHPRKPVSVSFSSITVERIYRHSFTVWADLQVASNEQTFNDIVTHCKLAFNSDCNEFLLLPPCGPIRWPLNRSRVFFLLRRLSEILPPPHLGCEAS